MNYQWDSYLKLLPPWLRPKVDKLFDRGLREIRMRIGRNIEAVIQGSSLWLENKASHDDINYCINSATKYSPWTSESIAAGYITAEGGHRIGICGETVLEHGYVSNIRRITSICVRVCRDVFDIANPVSRIIGSILIIGKPGSGKTTFLRDLIRTRSDVNKETVAAVDERNEIFPVRQSGFCFYPGKRVDILSGCSKYEGIMCVLRSMTPQTIAVDEITESKDCDGLIHASWCGVHLLATAHAGSKDELFNRKVYAPMLSCCIFQSLVIMHDNQTWHMEDLRG